MMAPSDRQQKMLLELVVKCIVPTVCAALQIHFILMVAILLQHQKVKQEADLAIQEKNRALRRYRQLRNIFLRSKRRNWNNPGRTDEWWRNLMDRKMLPEEWNTNFRMSREDFLSLKKTTAIHSTKSRLISWRYNILLQKTCNDSLLFKRPGVVKNDQQYIWCAPMHPFFDNKESL